MLPLVTTTEQFRALNLRDSCFIDAARAVFARSNRTVNSTSLPSNGSLPVVFADDIAAVKFFPPLYADESEREIKALRFLSQHDVPKLLGAGEIHGWQYVLMSKLAGHSLKELWPNFSPETRRLACAQIGKKLRKIHDVNLPAGDFDLTSWASFLSSQKLACFSRHEKLGLREDLLKQIPAFIDSVDFGSHRLSFLHTEVMRDHVFFNIVDEQIIFSGFIDFEPSMVGPFEYDFASIGIFVTSGDREALRAFFEGYGNLDQVSNREFRRRIMAYALLHKYSNLKWYLQFMPNADSLDELAELWWGI
jgi:hygromycin-B 7''-O-kinase